jgi:hypothetical protein
MLSRVAEVFQRAGDVITPLPDRVLSRAQLQRREQDDIDRKPGRHADADVDHPVSDVAERLIARTPPMTTIAMPAISGPSKTPAGIARAAPSKKPAT